MRSSIARLTRRGFIRTSAAATGAALLPVSAFALTETQAADLIKRVVADVLSIINSGKSEAAMLKDFEAIFRDYADVPTIARYCLGAPWRTATAAQQAAYMAAFQTYVSRKYGRQFRKFAGATVKIIKSRDAGRLGILVETSMTLQNQSPFSVEWNVSDRSGQDKFINLIVEGISMLATERTEVGSMLEAVQGNIDKLIVNLKSA